MAAGNLAALQALRGGPRDGALLRMSLAQALAAAGERDAAVVELRAAVGFDAGYSAAWKQLGRLLAEAGDKAGAIDAWERGIAAATQRGDTQAGKEMAVFLRRVRRGEE